MIVVADSGPLIHLSRIGQLDLLSRLYGEVIIPRRVYEEVVEHGQGRAGSAEVAQAAWVRIAEHPDASHLAGRFAEQLDSGEAAAIHVAEDLGADLLLIDEEMGRRVAVAVGLTVKGTLGVLVDARRQGVVERVEPLISALRASGTWISERVIREALREAGELTSGPFDEP